MTVNGGDAEESRLVAGHNNVARVEGGCVPLSAAILLTGIAPGDGPRPNQHMPTELGQIKALLEEPRLLSSDTVEHVDAMAVVYVPGGHAPVGTPKDASPLGNRRGVNDFTLESPALQGLASALLTRRKRELGRSDHGCG